MKYTFRLRDNFLYHQQEVRVSCSNLVKEENIHIYSLELIPSQDQGFDAKGLCVDPPQTAQTIVSKKCLMEEESRKLVLSCIKSKVHDHATIVSCNDTKRARSQRNLQSNDHVGMGLYDGYFTSCKERSKPNMHSRAWENYFRYSPTINSPCQSLDCSFLKVKS